MIEDRVVLLVEDNPTDEALTLRALRKANVCNETVVVRDGAEALDYLFARGTHAGRAAEKFPALVLLDLKLPKVDGLEVLRQLRDDPRTKLVPVVVLTSSNEDADVIQSYARGCNSYVRKPVEFTQFAEAVRQLGLYWLVVNSPPPGTGRTA